MQARTSVLIYGAMVLLLAAVQPVMAGMDAGAESKLALGPLNSRALPDAVQRALESGDFKRLRAAVVSELKGKAGLSYKDAETVHLAMLQEWIRVTGEDVLTKMGREDKNQQKFLERFARDAEWLELYLSCGLVPYQTATGMNVLYRIWCEEEGKVKNKALAVALASCWGGGETWKNPPIEDTLPTKFNPVRRYMFFQRQEARGLLHPNYPNLKPWELRFVVANPGQDWDDASYEFAAQAINMPWDKYHLAYEAATYTGISKFGDSVQGGAYNLPFANESTAETTLRNGGVCGAMSHLGAVAAMAHGIPAFTVGQPGHCAYGVRPERGRWTAGFTSDGRPDGYMHNMIFGHRAPTSYCLMEAVFADDKKVARAYRKSFCARALEAAGDKEKAEKAWLSVLKDSPMHPFFRAALHQLMVERQASPEQSFEYLTQRMLPVYEGHGVAAMDAMDNLEPLLEKLDEEQLLQVYHLVHKALSTTQSSWATKLDSYMQKHTSSLKSEDARRRYLEDMFAQHMMWGDGTTFGQLLEWAVKNYVATEEGSKIFNKAFAKAAESAGSSKGESDLARNKKMAEAYGKAIVAAEQARSAPAFAALTKGALSLCKPVEQADFLQKTGEVKGKPAKAVLFRISTTSPHDTPALHAGVMTPEGGMCHTSKERRPSFIVELEKPGFVSGCIVRKSNGNESRMKKAIISTSEDGATWFERASIDNMPKEWAVSLPDGTRARWVRLEFENEQDAFAHISHFVVFTL